MFLPACVRAFRLGPNSHEKRAKGTVESRRSPLSSGDAEAVYAVDYRGLTRPPGGGAAREPARARRLASASSRTRSPCWPPTRPASSRSRSWSRRARPPSRSCGATRRWPPRCWTRSRVQANVLEVKGGLMGGRTLAADEIRQLARLPARDALDAQFAGIVASPITGLVRGLGSLVGGLAVALEQVRGQKEAAGPGRGSRCGSGSRAESRRRRRPPRRRRRRRPSRGPAAEAAEPEPEAPAEEQQPDSETDSDAEKEAQ